MDFDDVEQKYAMRHEDVQDFVYIMSTSRGRKTDSSDDDLHSDSETERTPRPPKKSMIPMTKEYTTRIMASLVPDEVINNVNDYTPRQFESCVMFGDISGFTDLSDKYHKSGVGGASRFTAALNIYLGKMVQEILSHGGDLHKFSGDGFLAVWKTEISDSMTDIVHQAVDCSLTIQKSLGKYETDVGVFLKVKLALATGCTTFSLIGDQNTSYYVCIGQPVVDVKMAQEIANAGEIIIAPSASYYLGVNEYLSIQMRDNAHLKIIGKGPNWKPTHKSNKSDTEIYHRKTKISYIFGYEDEIKSVMPNNFFEEEDGFFLRPSINTAISKNIKNDLRKFIIPPVMRGIDLDEPLEYLTEMRQVVIMFVNVITAKIPILDYLNIINEGYKIIYSVAETMQGCVNKVNTFDKDLMFVVLFGLRGYKHELESQTGLRCASECFQAISKIKDVTSVSIGVTTGMSYCGVVGHALRREYTVMSLTVNKAARLMCAYPNKVTCDRETFLHSKMEANSFILQEAIKLKGISNAGTIYEFKENPIMQGVYSISPFPLLGNSTQLRLYKQILRKFLQAKSSVKEDLEQNYFRTVIISGDMRQGKTRLLDEMVFCNTPSNVPVNRFTLGHLDTKIPFRTLFLLFALPLGLNDTTSITERRHKIVTKLNNNYVQDMLHALNPIFNVNFEPTAFYSTLKQEEQTTILKKSLERLALAIFVTNWVIAIDDADYIDAESGDCLQVLISMENLFFLMTRGNRRTRVLETILNHSTTKYLNILPIERMYHAGLACQILEVYAIPLELEKMLQLRSNGNPGWIENFLLTLLQSNSIIIENLTRKDIQNLGLVSPPTNMMIRLPDVNDISLPKVFIDIDIDQELSLRGSIDQQNLMESPFLGRLQLRNKIPVCIFSPLSKLEDIDPEMPMDVRIIKTFDALTSFEQLLLKCSSVLGEVFNREMLLFVMSTTKLRSTALAIQKLFEIHVLRCAEGNFITSENRLICRQFLKYDSDFGIKCKCIGVRIDSSCQDLPDYASCGYMKFSLPEFRITTYNLLTDNQKREFHNRAIHFLERATRRCNACGGGLFVRILGTKRDDVITILLKKSIPFLTHFCLHLKGLLLHTSDQPNKAPRKRGNTIFSTLWTGKERSSFTTESLIHAPSHEAIRNNFSNNLIRHTSISEVKALQLRALVKYKRSAPGGSALRHFKCGASMVRQLKDSFSLTKTFSYADFEHCKCSTILTAIYTEMIQHCNGAGMYDLLLAALIEYAQVCINTCNVPQAIAILDQASNLVQRMETNTPEETWNEMHWRLPLVRGKIETLHGHARYQLGHTDEALKYFFQSLNSFGYSFPTSKMKIKVKTLGMELSQRFNLYLFTQWFANDGGDEAEFYDNVSECLAFIFSIFKDARIWKQAELAAVWSLNVSLKSGTTFSSTCTAFANMIEVAHRMGKGSLCVALEVHGLRFCHRKWAKVEAEELKAVCKMYTSIFIARFLRAELKKTIHIGMVLLGMCVSIRVVQISIEIMSLLVHALMLKSKVFEASCILQQLQYYANDDKDNTGITCYYGLCMAFQLETGYTIQSFQQCEKFYQNEFTTLRNIRDEDAKQRFYIIMWLWCLRHNLLEAARLWYVRAKNISISAAEISSNSIFTNLYLLEGQLLYLNAKINCRDLKTAANIIKKAKRIFKDLDNVSKTNKIILPRLYHYKAYFEYILNKPGKAFKRLKLAKEFARKQENSLELAWIMHTYKAWKNLLSTMKYDMWIDHCKTENFIDYHEAVDRKDLIFFTLPTPKFY